MKVIELHHTGTPAQLRRTKLLIRKHRARLKERGFFAAIFMILFAGFLAILETFDPVIFTLSIYYFYQWERETEIMQHLRNQLQIDDLLSPDHHN